MALPGGVSWEWMQDGGYWLPYDPGAAAQIEAAFEAGDATTTTYSATGGRNGTGAGYKIDLGSMNQVNSSTGFTRRVRRIATSSPAAWEYGSNNDGASWTAFDASVSSLLCAADDAGRATVALHVDVRRSLLLNLGAGQRVDQRTGHVSHIRRITVPPLSPPLPAAATAAAAVRSTAAPATVGASSQSRSVGRRGVAGAAAAAVSGSGCTTGVQQEDEEEQEERKAAAPSGGGTRGGGSSSNVAAITGVGEFEAEFWGAEDATAAAAEDDICALCHDEFDDGEAGCEAIRLRDCNGHYMHKECIIQTFKRMGPKCPTCGKGYGVLRGTQPPGTMTVGTSDRHSCPGFEGHGTITISYSFSNGIQGVEHPSPGQAYAGTHRVAYLPDSPEGREVLRLLQTCFERRLTFTVGTSITTGRSNCVVWNGVHHKTSIGGGSASFGYPDPTYLDRVKEELAAKGISP